MFNDHGAGGYATGNLRIPRHLALYAVSGDGHSNQDLGNRKEVIAIPAIATWRRQQHRNVIAEKSAWVGRALGGWEMREGIGIQSPAGGIWKIRVP